VAVGRPVERRAALHAIGILGMKTGARLWIFDDLPLLHQMMDAGARTQSKDARLFHPEDAYCMQGGGGVQLPPTATIG